LLFCSVNDVFCCTDETEDFNQNGENANFYEARLSSLQKQIEKKANFFKLKKFRPSQFCCIESDLIAVENMGKIMDNSLTDAPMVLFDTQNFASFEYRHRQRTFVELPLIDIENYSENFPKAFK
jgi:hypothetical protein